MTDIAAGKVPVLKCFEQAWRFLFENWRLFLPVSIVPAAGAVLSTMLSTSMGGVFLGLVLGTIASAVLSATVLRKAIREEYARPYGVAFGADELRLIATQVCFALLIFPFAILFGLLFSVGAIGRAGMNEEQIEAISTDPEAVNKLFADFLGTPMGASIALFCLIAVALLGVRLFLVNAATIGERRIVFFQTWSWSKGNVLRILGAIVLTALPAAITNLILAELLVSIVGQSGSLPILSLASGIASLIGSLLSVPVIALGAILYKGLRPPGFVAK
jgi:hypothetical protein